MSKPLARARQLIAIVVDGDPEDASRTEERRTAAVTACRTIHEHKLLEPRGSRARRSIFDDAVEVDIDEVHRRRAAECPSRSPQPEVDEDEQARRQAETDPNIPHCNYCNRRIRWGEQVVFRLGQPMVHVVCYPKWKLTVPRHMW